MIVALDISGVGAGVLVIGLSWVWALILGSAWLERFNNRRLDSERNRQLTRASNRVAAHATRWGGTALGVAIVVYSLVV